MSSFSLQNANSFSHLCANVRVYLGIFVKMRQRMELSKYADAYVIQIHDPEIKSTEVYAQIRCTHSRDMKEAPHTSLRGGSRLPHACICHMHQVEVAICHIGLRGSRCHPHNHSQVPITTQSRPCTSGCGAGAVHCKGKYETTCRYRDLLLASNDRANSMPRPILLDKAKDVSTEPKITRLSKRTYSFKGGYLCTR